MLFRSRRASRGFQRTSRGVVRRVKKRSASKRLQHWSSSRRRRRRGFGGGGGRRRSETRGRGVGPGRSETGRKRPGVSEGGKDAWTCGRHVAGSGVCPASRNRGTRERGWGGVVHPDAGTSLGSISPWRFHPIESSQVRARTSHGETDSASLTGRSAAERPFLQPSKAGPDE